MPSFTQIHTSALWHLFPLKTLAETATYKSSQSAIEFFCALETDKSTCSVVWWHINMSSIVTSGLDKKEIWAMEKKELKEKRQPVWVATKISPSIESKGELMSLILFLADTVVCPLRNTRMSSSNYLVVSLEKGNFCGSVSASFSLSQPILLNPIFGMFLCMFFQCSKFNKDHNLLLLLKIWLDIFYSRNVHKIFG